MGDDDDHLRCAADLAAARADLLAGRIYARAARHPDGLAGVAVELGLPLPGLYRLGLRRRPVTLGEIVRLAQQFGVAPVALARIVFDSD